MLFGFHCPVFVFSILKLIYELSSPITANGHYIPRWWFPLKYKKIKTPMRYIQY